MAMSIDGKIATKARSAMKLGSSFDTRRMAEIRAEHDVVVNGSGTFRVYPVPLKVEGRDLIERRLKEGHPVQPASAVVTSRLKIPSGTAWEKAEEIERWAFCGKKAEAKTIARLEKAGVKVVKSRGERVGPKEVLAAFKKAGKERVLLEGGGEFNAQFLELGLVDKIHLTVAPLIIGGVDAPTWFEGKGFPRNFPRFRLADCQNIAGELYLTYLR